MNVRPKGLSWGGGWSEGWGRYSADKESTLGDASGGGQCGSGSLRDPWGSYLKQMALQLREARKRGAVEEEVTEIQLGERTRG